MDYVPYLALLYLVVAIILLSLTLHKQGKNACAREKYCVQISPFKDEYCGCDGYRTIF